MKLFNNNRIDFGLFDYPLDHINTSDITEKNFFNFFPFNFSKRLNQFHFTGIIGKDFFIGIAVVDLKVVTKAFCYIFDLNYNKVDNISVLSLPSKKSRFISLTPEKENTLFLSKKLKIKLTYDRVEVSSSNLNLNVRFKRAKNPIRLCTRTGHKGWTFTKKELPIEISEGFLEFNGKTHRINSPDYYMVSDWTIGLMRRETFWNWASSASILPSGKTLGLNFSCGVNETSYTENAFWVDGIRTKVDLVSFQYEDPQKPWIIKSRDKKVNLIFTPLNQYQEKVNAILFASCFYQLAGTFKGELTCDTGEIINIDSCPGWTEDHYAKW